MVVFMFPETKWHRLHPNEVIKQLAAAENKISPTESAEKVHASGEAIEHNDPEKNGGTLSQVPTHGTMPDLSHQATADRDPHLGKGTPSKQQWKLWQSNAHPWKSIALDLFIPWKLFLFPIVELASFIVSWSCSSFLTLNLTQSQNFAEPPYNFNSQSVSTNRVFAAFCVFLTDISQIGFMNFAILIGALIGLATAGPLSDWVSARSTRKNRGIREPEMRLVAMSQCHLLSLHGRGVDATVGSKFDLKSMFTSNLAFWLTSIGQFRTS